MQPTMCSRCGKNVAVVFITKIENGQAKNEGLCLKCARELHIKPVDDMINKMGITDDELDNLTGEMMSALTDGEDIAPVDDDGSDEEDDGKTATFPFLNRLFGGGPSASASNESQNQGGEPRRGETKENPPKGGKRKFLDNYCIDLTARAREGKLDTMIGREEELERVILLKSIDSKWMDHIDDMEILRQGIGLTAYGQRDPVVEYKMAAFDMFNSMITSIQEDTVRMLYHVHVEQKIEREQVAKVTGTNKDDSSVRKPVQRKEIKVYPNDPCPCGSGKKYKQCCGRKTANV